MNKPKILNTVLNILLFLIVFSIIIGIILTVLMLMGVTHDSIDLGNLKTYEKNTPDIFFFMALTLCVYFIFIYGIFKLKKAANLFLDNDLYSSELAKNINISGKCMIISGIFWWFLGGLSTTYFEKSISIEVSDKTFIYLFFVAIGLFMMLMSKVSTNAIELKNENDLTI